MKILARILLFVLLPIGSFGQDFSFRGQVVDINEEPLSFVNVLVARASDSTFVKGSSTDDSGNFKIEGLPSDSYFVKFSYIGYAELLIPLILNEDKNLTTVVLEEDVTSLDEVNITVKKPTIKKEADRLIFSVENTALVEGDMLQVIRSTPGVLVQESGITVKGATPVVYINDRKIQLSPSEITQLLESSSANSIKSVEVITNPSAKYDADSGVVISIVMGKNLISGYHGSVSTAYTQGVFPRYDANTNHFFKNEKLSFNLNYNFSKDQLARPSEDNIDYFHEDGMIDQIWRSDSHRNTKKDTHNASFNFDYFIDEKNTLSLSSSLLLVPDLAYRIDGRTLINEPSGELQSSFNSLNNSEDDTQNLAFDLDYRHDFKKGNIKFNSHYTNYQYERLQGIQTDYFDASGNPTQINAFRTDADQATDILTSKIDYSIPLNDKSDFEAGIKYSGVTIESGIDQFTINPDSGNEMLDASNSDEFDYDENVYAAYANYALSTEKWSVNVGLRAEQTTIEGNSRSEQQVNTQDYLELFPNASIQYNLSDNFEVHSNYKRSIRRPNYADLNPFRVFVNENLIAQGNPGLQPTFTDHYVIGTTLFGKFTIEAYYKNIIDDVYELPFQDNDNQIITYTSTNLDESTDYGFDFLTYFNLADWWYVYAVTSFYNVEERTDFGLGSVTRDLWSNYSEVYNDFTFLKDGSLTASLSLTYWSKIQTGLRTVDGRFYSELAISKSILKNRASISLSAGDLFNKQDERSRFRVLNQSSSVTTDIDNRFIKLGFRYNFGNTRLENNKRGISQEERDRISKKL